MGMRQDLMNSWEGRPLADAHNFERLLFDLIANADPVNRGRLRLGFPKQVEAWEMWYSRQVLPDISVPSGE